MCMYVFEKLAYFVCLFVLTGGSKLVVDRSGEIFRRLVWFMVLR